MALKSMCCLGFVYKEKERTVVGNGHVIVPMVFCMLFIGLCQVASTNTRGSSSWELQILLLIWFKS